MADDLSIAEVAARYGVDLTTAQRWARKGYLPGAELRIVRGRAMWRVPAEALADFVPPKPGRPPEKRQ